MRTISVADGRTDAFFSELPEPGQPGPEQVLCRTLQLGICGTDREIVRSGHPKVPPGDVHLALGHECLARVEAVGDQIQNLSVGDLVVPTVRRPVPHPATGASGPEFRLDMEGPWNFTERGIFRQHGFSAPWWLETPEFLLKVDPQLSSVAVLAEPLAVAEKAINEAEILQKARLGAEIWTATPPRVLVLGMGPIGFAAVLAAVARGWPTTLYGRDPQESRRVALCHQLGASYLSAEEVTWQLDDPDADGYDLVIECTGQPQLLVQATGAMANAAIQVWLATGGRGDEALNLSEAMFWGFMRSHILMGCVNSAYRDFEDALKHLAWWKSHNEQALQAVITARVPLDQSLWHFSNRQPQGIKVVVEYPQNGQAS